ncbi:DUF952 domain-containing protein [Oscillatoria sp. FACHB-1407]|uniref:DUF952 domain-containing protein n=1 Tax=Oscillatoria sp. FACHB-1407 TaxID=2692847 RepID=UPI00168964F8|nr:DUF952 domain-containing protein [Oscillatoria sp. FACHB-1407]MBD2462454.1 DUF952 domain-containing protein [Oscillatoria sp. FACHB-1407]
MIFHITSRSHWQQAQSIGEYRADSLTTEGFIHCSKAEQVIWVANQFYRNSPDLVLLHIDPSKLTAELRYDAIETGEEFPHLYGALNLDAVTQVIDFSPQPDGTFSELS